MRWMRGLLRDFADRGGTVLLSSHLLGEVQAVADRIVIIGAGRIVAQGARDDLLADAGTLVSATDPRGSRSRCGPPASTPAPQPTARSWSTPPPRPSGAPRFRAASPSRTWGPPRGRASRPCTSSYRQGGRMSAATLAHPAHVPSPSHARPGLARLTAVELRKMTDTRAGFWLQLSVVALTVVVVVAACLFARPEDQTLR